MPDVAEQVTTLRIDGMSCAACSSFVEKTLREVPGVQSAQVSLLAHQATVHGTADRESLVAAVQDAGYQAALPAASSAGSQANGLPAEETGSHLGRRAVVALGIAAASMVLGMALMDPSSGPAGLMRLLPRWLMGMPAEPVRWVLLILSLAVMLGCSPETYVRAWQAARHKTTNMSTLVAIGTLSAFGWSAIATLMPAWLARHAMRPAVYFEAVDFILAFLLLGASLDARAKRETQGALRALSRLTPEQAQVMRNGVEITVPVAELLTGEVVRVGPGQLMPVDGLVLHGESSVNESLLTGESLPVPRQAGQRVMAGTMNLDGVLQVEATSLGADSTLAQLRRLLMTAQASRAPMQKLADRASAIFVPVVLALAALTFAVWLGVGAGLPRALGVAISVLVIACPCAMGLAVPAALTVGIGRAAQLGVLIKNGEALERLAGISAIALDKTGTLTMGQPSITQAHFARSVYSATRRSAVDLAAAMERDSEHPLARAVLHYAGPMQATPSLCEFRVLPGQGVSATLAQPWSIWPQGASVLLGNERLVPGEVREEGTVVRLAVNGAPLVTFLAEDQLRPEAAGALQSLRRLGVRPTMLTGDTAAVASRIGSLAGLAASEIRGGLLPADKVHAIEELQAAGPVAMVGDGLNDAAALARADAGIAISGQGAGTDLTREAADAVLLRPDLRLLPLSLRLARRTVSTMRQNLGWAVLYNLLGLPLAAGVLYPRFHLLLSPAIASAAMALSSVSVLANSLRLRGFKE